MRRDPLHGRMVRSSRSPTATSPCVASWDRAAPRRWTLDPPGYGDDLGPCLTGAVVLSDGTIVTAIADGLATIAP